MSSVASLTFCERAHFIHCEYRKRDYVRENVKLFLKFEIKKNCNCFHKLISKNIIFPANQFVVRGLQR